MHLVILGAFFGVHILFLLENYKKYNLPLTIGAIQTLIVALFSLIIGLIFEDLF